jgi:hypothetical protein
VDGLCNAVHRPNALLFAMFLGAESLTASSRNDGEAVPIVMRPVPPDALAIGTGSCATPSHPDGTEAPSWERLFLVGNLANTQNVVACCNLDTILNFVFCSNQLRSAQAAICVRECLFLHN